MGVMYKGKEYSGWWAALDEAYEKIKRLERLEDAAYSSYDPTCECEMCDFLRQECAKSNKPHVSD